MDIPNLNKDILDRSMPPQAMPMKKITLPPYSQTRLSNGIQVYFLPFGNVEVTDVQVVFRAGKAFQQKSGQAGFTTRNMSEGTKSYQSLELSQILDNFGAWISPSSGSENISVSLSTLTHHIESTLPLLHEVALMPEFPVSEFDKMKQRTLEKMHVNEQKTNNIAGRRFSDLFYGATHPYGSYFGVAELETLERDDLVDYYRKYLYPGNFSLMVVGRFDENKMLSMLDATFGHLDLKAANVEKSPAIDAKPVLHTGREYVEKEGMQATLRLGHKGLSFRHPDYYQMVVVNTILGGYFGSRLMKNIREEKGYTYGIYSSFAGQKHDGHFVVQGDVGNQYIEATITEVKKEMNKLMEDGVEEDELQLVKNYLLGKAISQRETPFQMAGVLRFAVENELSFEEIDQKLEIYQNITAEEVRALAQKYLHPDDMLEVVVGKLG